MIPTWVADVVLRGDMPQRDVLKLTFTLTPLDPKSVKRWKEVKLTGARGTRVKTIARHVITELDIKLPVESATDVRAAREWLPNEVVEVWCANRLLSPTLTLAAVRQFIWKSSDDLLLHFGFTEKYRNYIAHKEN